jgi:hypothetical protein
MIETKDQRYRHLHRDEIAERRKILRAANPGRDARHAKRYRERHPEAIKESVARRRKADPVKFAAYLRLYRQSHRERLNAQFRKRWAADPLFRLKWQLRSRIFSALKSIGVKKDARTEDLIGCSAKELMRHLSEKFKPGMTWGNRSAWHIDHKIPLCSAKTKAEMIGLFHYSNLQPLWAEENFAKSGKLL